MELPAGPVLGSPPTAAQIGADRLALDFVSPVEGIVYVGLAVLAMAAVFVAIPTPFLWLAGEPGAARNLVAVALLGVGGLLPMGLLGVGLAVFRVVDFGAHRVETWRRLGPIVLKSVGPGFADVVEGVVLGTLVRTKRSASWTYRPALLLRDGSLFPLCDGWGDRYPESAAAAARLAERIGVPYREGKPRGTWEVDRGVAGPRVRFEPGGSTPEGGAVALVFVVGLALALGLVGAAGLASRELVGGR